MTANRCRLLAINGLLVLVALLSSSPPIPLDMKVAEFKMWRGDWDENLIWPMFGEEDPASILAILVSRTGAADGLLEQVSCCYVLYTDCQHLYAVRKC